MMGLQRTSLTNAERQAAWRHKKALERLRQIPTVELGPCTLYQGDANVIAPLLSGVHALITDPPYGTGFDFTKRRRSAAPLLDPARLPRPWEANVRGDDVPFIVPSWLLDAPQVILWGAQHFATQLPTNAAWIVWDKREGTTPDHFGDGELAWTNLAGPLRIHYQLSRGLIRAGEENLSRGGKKLHPCQKPVALMRFCVAKTTGLVCDPFMGSGTTGVACIQLGRPFIGIELEPRFFDVACHRIEQALQQGQLFAPPVRATRQPPLFASEQLLGAPQSP